MNIIKSAKISRFLLKSVRDFNEFHTPRINVQLSENPAARYALSTADIAFCHSKWQETRKIPGWWAESNNLYCCSVEVDFFWPMQSRNYRQVERLNCGLGY